LGVDLGGRRIIIKGSVAAFTALGAVSKIAWDEVMGLVNAQNELSRIRQEDLKVTKKLLKVSEEKETQAKKELRAKLEAGEITQDEFDKELELIEFEGKRDRAVAKRKTGNDGFFKSLFFPETKDKKTEQQYIEDEARARGIDLHDITFRRVGFGATAGRIVIKTETENAKKLREEYRRLDEAFRASRSPELVDNTNTKGEMKSDIVEDLTDKQKNNEKQQSQVNVNNINAPTTNVTNSGSTPQSPDYQSTDPRRPVHTDGK
jgi:hypothetical protein